jgi:hypothetical protein
LGFTKITAPAEDIAGLAKVNIGDRVVVATVVIDALASLDLRCPKVSEAQRQELGVAKKQLIANGNS